ncbi:hypothetical protein TIFTF001_011706 [Ficus carica]|uniref:Uncharacterized protein n=1 Tax=Ficus carica TaxID=3494 RepID=A0AA88D321_FICCA|nr:hypothetical protein TIFTF001_011706 [Ficus carica]
MESPFPRNNMLPPWQAELGSKKRRPDSIVSYHELVTEETSAPQQPRRRLQRAYTKSHHTTTVSTQLRHRVPATFTFAGDQKKKKKSGWWNWRLMFQKFQTSMEVKNIYMYMYVLWG